MATTRGALKARLAVLLQDPSARTFTAGMLEELIRSALAEVSRIAPEQYTEDLTPVANQVTYLLRSAAFGAVEQQEIEVMRAEVWDVSKTPQQFVARIDPAFAQPVSGVDSGWYSWNGLLYLPTRTVSALVGREATHRIRVWGYSPYVVPTADSGAGSAINVSDQVEQAMLWFCRLEALGLILASRDLFTQWQTRSGNSDVTYAGLMNQRSIAESAWRVRARSIARLRSGV